MKLAEPGDITPGQRIAVQIFGITGAALLNRQEAAELIDAEFKRLFQEELVTGHASSPYHLIRSLREVQQYYDFASKQKDVGKEKEIEFAGAMAMHLLRTTKTITDELAAGKL